jgi:ATP-dependent Zn protease
MTGTESAAGMAAEYDVLRTLAQRARGLTGADIERLVREARHKARRGQRALEYGDLANILKSGNPERPLALRRRMAVHESGHAIAYLALGLGRITTITIDSRGGGYIEGEIPDPSEETEELAKAVLVMRLAGRAAEQEILGAVTAGSGGSPDSDLATATALATRMETEFGFGMEAPLLYRPIESRSTLFTYHPSLAERVNARLEEAYAEARTLIRGNRAAIEFLAAALMRHGTLEGNELNAVLVGVRSRMIDVGTRAWPEHPP